MKTFLQAPLNLKNQSDKTEFYIFIESFFYMKVIINKYCINYLKKINK